MRRPAPMSTPSQAPQACDKTGLAAIRMPPCAVLRFVAAYQPALRVALLPTCRAIFHSLLAEELPLLALATRAGSTWVSSRRARRRRMSEDWLSWSACRFKATQDTAIGYVTAVGGEDSVAARLTRRDLWTNTHAGQSARQFQGFVCSIV